MTQLFISGTKCSNPSSAYLLTGRRRSEVLNLCWADLDLEGGFYRYTGKGGKERQRTRRHLARLQDLEVAGEELSWGPRRPIATWAATSSALGRQRAAGRWRERQVARQNP